MKKNVIALFVAAVMVVCSIGTTTAKAVETDEEVEMSSEEFSEGEAVQVMEEGTTESEEAVDQDECIGALAESPSEGFEESTETKSVQESEETPTEIATVEEQNTVEETLVRVGLIGPFQVGLKGPQMSRVKKANVWDYQSGRLGSAQTRPSSGRQERDTVPFCRTGYSVSFRQGLPGRWRVQRTVP